MKRQGCRRVLLLGYFDRGNIGDDVMRDALVSFAAESFATTPLRSRSLPSLPRPGAREVLDLLASLRWADIVVLAGGSHFHDRFGRRSVRLLTSFVLLFAVARALGCRVAYAGIGVGPLSGRLTRALTRILLRLSSTTLVRDSASARAVRELRRSGPLLQGSDVAAFLPVAGSSSDGGLRTLGVSLLPYFGVYQRDFHRDHVAIRTLAESVLEVHRADPLAVHAFPFYRGCASVPRERTDVPLTTAFTRLLEHRVPLCPPVGARVHDLLNGLRAVDGLVAMRYHAALLGFLLDLPLVVVTYDQKVREFAREVQLPANATLTPDDLLERAPVLRAVEGLMARPDDFRAKLPTKELRHRARTGLARFAEVLCAEVAHGGRRCG